MKVKLLRDARIKRKAGEIVEVSPDDFAFLVSVGSAIEVKDAAPAEKAVKAIKAETPERKSRKK